MSDRPLVSIGVPVYNGENYLRQALECLVAQDYDNFQLIISDNASTDGTPGICREIAGHDKRIGYVRQEENHGSPWNFKFVASQARGKYFMWAAHDDLWAPTFVSKCVEKLEANPQAVLCCTEINFIDGAGKPSVHYQGYTNIGTLGLTPTERIHELISLPGWFAVYGMMRREALQKISLGLGTYGYDVVLLLELLLQGDFAKVPEALFSFRILIEGKTAEDYQKDFNAKAPASAAPYAGLALHLMETVWRSQLTVREKTEVFADFLLTLSREDLPWRASIAQELVVPDATLSRNEFVNLLGLLLERAIPLVDLPSDPFSKVIFRPSAEGLDLLGVAREFAGERSKAAYIASVEGKASKAAPGGIAAGTAAVTTSDGSFFRRQAARMVELGKLEEASKLFRASLDEHETSDTWADWATVQFARGLTADAEQGFRRAIQVDAQNSSAALKLGILLARQGRKGDAVPLLEEGMRTMTESQRAPIEPLLAECRSQSAAVMARPRRDEAHKGALCPGQLQPAFKNRRVE
jgi:tetratricopeptide (TPR) repeat protein